MANFRDAIQMCSRSNKVLENDYLKQELMPVDKLRYFQKEAVPLDNGCVKGLFRINAIKFNNTWYEYSRKDFQKINVNNFDDFNIHRGMDGKWISFV